MGLPRGGSSGERMGPGEEWSAGRSRKGAGVCVCLERSLPGGAEEEWKGGPPSIPIQVRTGSLGLHYPVVTDRIMAFGLSRRDITDVNSMKQRLPLY